MKKNSFIKIIFSMLLILLLAFSVPVLATDTNTSSSDDNEILATYETDYEYIDSDLFLYDNNIEISQDVNGNVFAYGSTVNISGEISGDIFIFANSLTIEDDSIIYGNVFTYATDVKIAGIVSDVYAISNNFSLEPNGGIARNLYLMSNTVSIGGKISRDAFISSENLSLGNTLGDNTEAVIQGDLNYTSSTEAVISDGLVNGDINYTPVATDSSNVVWSVIFNLITTLLFAFVVIMLSIWLTPKFKDRVSEIVAKKSFVAFGIGILVFLVSIVLAFILFIFSYGFGVAIALALIALLVLAYSISNTVFSMAIGKLIADKLNLNKNVAFVLFSLLVVLILEGISYIPYVGGPITFITSIVGLGTLCINAYKRKDLVNSES